MSKQHDSSIGVDQLVREYLQSKGYMKALEALEVETGGGGGGGGQPGQAVENNLSANRNSHNKEKYASLLLNNTAETLYVVGIHHNDTSIYTKEFEFFCSWVMNSLDMLKPYLEAIALTIFIHW